MNNKAYLQSNLQNYKKHCDFPQIISLRKNFILFAVHMLRIKSTSLHENDAQ